MTTLNSIPQTLHQFNDGDATFAFERHEQYDWRTGETSQQVRVSRQHSGSSAPALVIPLADAVELAKAILEESEPAIEDDCTPSVHALPY